jgi:hypothetical protein
MRSSCTSRFLRPLTSLLYRRASTVIVQSRRGNTLLRTNHTRLYKSARQTRQYSRTSGVWENSCGCLEVSNFHSLLFTLKTNPNHQLQPLQLHQKHLPRVPGDPGHNLKPIKDLSGGKSRYFYTFKSELECLTLLRPKKGGKTPQKTQGGGGGSKRLPPWSPTPQGGGDRIWGQSGKKRPGPHFRRS